MRSKKGEKIYFTELHEAICKNIASYLAKKKPA
jgi:hypothetical protein